MHDEIPKAVKKRIRELAAVAHERRLTAALGDLEGAFASWRQGTIDAFDLSDRIHAFHDGTARDLWKAYAAASMLDMFVARDIAAGTLTVEEAGPEVMAALRPQIEGPIR